MTTWVCATHGPVPAGEIRHLDHNSPHGHEQHECGSSAGLDWTTDRTPTRERNDMNRPVIIDMFCGEGGASEGYYRAGFDPIGVDINDDEGGRRAKPLSRYPFRSHEGDALALLPELVERYQPVAIAASPTCQTRSRATAWRGRREDHPDLLTPTLALLDQVGLPYVVENVPEAAWDGTMRPDYLLCGTQFGLNVKRHRVFQRGYWDGYALLPPCTCYRNPALLPFEHKNERAFADALGCDWMTKMGGRQAIPPAYTEFIGEQLMAHIAAAVPAA